MQILRAFAHAVVVLLVVVANAQEPTLEYGDASELRGITTFFVDAGEDLDLRNIIREVLTKQLKLTIVEKSEGADHVVVFRWHSCGNNHVCGRAFVAKRVGSERLRILSNYRASEMDVDDLATEYAKWLVKQLRTVSTDKSAH
jgi:hypothetical protein